MNLGEKEVVVSKALPWVGERCIQRRSAIVRERGAYTRENAGISKREGE